MDGQDEFVEYLAGLNVVRFDCGALNSTRELIINKQMSDTKVL